MHQKAIFLDRDGTINKEVNYLTDKKDIVILNGARDALLNFKQMGYINIIITNQSAVARGLLTTEQLEEIHREFKRLLTVSNNQLIDDIFYSPFHIEGIIEEFSLESINRKPGIGMILSAAEKHKIDVKNSYIIGDSYADMKCGQNAGLKSIMVMTGYGKSELIKCKKEDIFIDYLAKDLLDASDYIKSVNLKN